MRSWLKSDTWKMSTITKCLLHFCFTPAGGLPQSRSGLTRDNAYNTAAQPSLSEAPADLCAPNNGLSSLVPNLVVLTPRNCRSACDRRLCGAA